MMRRTNSRGGFRSMMGNLKVAPTIMLLLGLVLLSWIVTRNELRTSIFTGFSSSSSLALHNRTSNNGNGTTFHNPSNDTSTGLTSLFKNKETELQAPFPAVQVLRRYIEQHSHQQLLSEWSSSSNMMTMMMSHQQEEQPFVSQNVSSTSLDHDLLHQRKYAVAYYWCPQRAGNILHSFFNTVVWSMIHNRTVLWMYHNSTANSSTQDEADCRAVLERAPWLPSYLEWKAKLGWDHDNDNDKGRPVPVSNSVKKDERPYDEDSSPTVVIYPQIRDVLAHDQSITRVAWSDHPLQTRTFRKYIKMQLSPWNQDIVAALYSEGMEFLYGMLYSQLFTLQHPTAASTTTSTILGQRDDSSSSSTIVDDNDNVFSVALHSRHTVGADDGSFVNHEQQCLDKLLQQSRPPAADHDNNYNKLSSTCRVHLMSDRPQTISILTQWLVEERNCSVVTAKHHVNNGPVQEHGPWAGAGYLEDLDVTARARYGVIGDPHRSSTALLIDLVEYRRKIDAWQNNNTAGGSSTNDEGTESLSLGFVKAKVEDLKVCELPSKHISGYDYGPGTPTFRHHSYLQPLAPIRVVDKYIQQDSSSSSHAVKEKRGTLWVSVDFNRPSEKGVYAALNGFLYAIVNNMDVRWMAANSNANDVSSICDDGGSVTPKSWAKVVFDPEEESTLLSNNNTSVIEVSLDKLLANGGATELETQYDLDEEAPSSVVLLQDAGLLHTDISEWNTLRTMAGKDTGGDNDGATTLLNDLFAHGPDVLFGLLFHELFSYCPYYPATINDEGGGDSSVPPPLSSRAAVLHLESAAASNDEEGSIRNCIESIFFPNDVDKAEEFSINGSFQDDETRCHIYILADSSTIEDTILASMVVKSSDESSASDESPPRLMLRRDRVCSFSFYPMIVSAAPEESSPQLQPVFWKAIQEASEARAGWIQPRASSSSRVSSDGEVLQASATLTRGRLEYKRHYETWKQGREPFWIPQLQECFY